MRSRLLIAAVAATAALVPAAPAHADASDTLCTIDGSIFLGGGVWPRFNEDYFTEPTTISGTATCTNPHVEETLRMTIGGDGWETLKECWPAEFSTYGYDGTITLTNQFGMRDTRTMSTNDFTGGTGTMLIGGSLSSGQEVAYSFSGSRCGMSGGSSSVSIRGAFRVPVAADNPRLFAKFSGLDHPDPIAVSADGATVYVGSFTTALTVLADRPPPSLAPSKVYAIASGSGQLVRTYTIAGQQLDKGHGLTGIALDSAGRLYVTDVAPARVVRLDPSTGAQSTYGTIPNFDESDLSRFGNRAPLPNGAAFGPDGSLYVTDTTQGVVWRVPPGGGTAQRWFRDQRLASFIGPNGIRLMADQKTLLFVVSNSQPPGALEGLQGKVYKLPITASGAPGALSTFWTGGTNEGPDSLAIAQSGNVYVAEAGDGARTGFVVLSPAGKVIARRRAPVHLLAADTSYDTVADVAFVGTKAIFTNSANFSGNVMNMSLFAYETGEPGLPILRPAVP